MQLRKDSVSLSVIDAVDILSDIAEWNQNIPSVQELSSDQKKLKEVFFSVLQYMQMVASKEQLKDEAVRDGLHAVMALAREAVAQIERIQGHGSVSTLQEVKNLELFYQQKISPHIPKELRELETGGKVEGESAGVDLLQDIERIRLDSAYELLLIRKEDGKGYFTRTLLHHINLVARFDALLLHLSDDHPFTKIKILSDRDCHEAAKESLKLAAPLIDAYYKEALKFKQLQFVSLINKALMALMLAANPRNLISHTTGKSAWGYYKDFQFYLRSAFTSNEYYRLVKSSLDRSEHFLHTVMLLSSELCSNFFLKSSPRKEGISLIHSLIKEGKKRHLVGSAKSSESGFWSHFLDKDESLRFYFTQYPSNPLLLASETLEKGELMQGFDPLSQGVYPRLVDTLSCNNLDVSVLRMPSPTRQQMINQAEMAPEFLAWIESMKSQGHHHLLINLQDRTSWKEYARCRCLEKNQHPELLSVVTFDKNTEFYYQSGSYLQGDDASEFMKVFKDQLLSESSGFYFPSEIKTAEFIDFIDPSLKAIHSLFFGKKEKLTEKNRSNFIDLFYLLLTLKIMEMLGVDSVSFVCKDGIDLGSVMDAQLLGFIQMMNGKNSLMESDVDSLLWMVYDPALELRGRVVNRDRLQRMVSCLEVVNSSLDADRDSVIKGLGKLYSIPFFTGSKINTNNHK